MRIAHQAALVRYCQSAWPKALDPPWEPTPALAAVRPQEPEMLVLDDFLRDRIASSPNVTEFRRLCIERGMSSLRDDGFAKVEQGVTSVEEVLRVTEATI